MAYYLPDGTYYSGVTHVYNGVVFSGESHTDSSQQLTQSNTDLNPHIREKFSPLETLAMQALRRFGDFHAGTVDGDVMMMFLEFANMIIDEIKSHPYHDNTSIDYYLSPTDVREVNDQIMIAGLLYHYSVQQASDRLQVYTPLFQRTLNQLLWNKYNGNTKIQMRVVDNGTNKGNINNGTTSTKNGSVTY